MRRLWVLLLSTLTVASCAHIGNGAAPGPPDRFVVESRPLGFDPDGNARWLLIVRFLDANGRTVRMMSDTDVEWTSSDGVVHWQTRMRFGQPSAILRTRRDGPLAVRVEVRKPALGTVQVRTDTRDWIASPIDVQALGPRAVQIGWFPSAAAVWIERTDATTGAHAMFSARGSSFLDAPLAPDHTYRYVVRDGAIVRSFLVKTPPDARPATVDDLRGIGMWLSFSNNPIDSDYAGRWNATAIVGQALRAHLRYVELRTAYGSFFTITPQVRANVDGVIDGLAQHGIATIAWTVPRDVTFEDLSATLASARYRTASGTPVRGVAVDLERGDEFMSDGSNGAAALARYMHRLREALGPTYALTAIVEDPYFEHLDNASYPYAAIARSATVLQPMAYWRMMRSKPTDAAYVRATLPQAVRRLLALAGRKLPVSIGGQTSAEGPNGHPAPEEILASIEAARDTGAIGVCFFDFDGTTTRQWSALEHL